MLLQIRIGRPLCFVFADAAQLVTHAWREWFGNDHPRVLRRKDRIVVPGDTEGEIVTPFLRRP